MSNLLRTTITIPEEILRQAKIAAAVNGESFSSFVSNILGKKVGVKTSEVKKNVDPLKTLGTINVSEEDVKLIDNVDYVSELIKKDYDDRIDRKMGVRL